MKVSGACLRRNKGRRQSGAMQGSGLAAAYLDSISSIIGIAFSAISMNQSTKYLVISPSKSFSWHSLCNSGTSGSQFLFFSSTRTDHGHQSVDLPERSLSVSLSSRRRLWLWTSYAKDPVIRAFLLILKANIGGPVISSFVTSPTISIQADPICIIVLTVIFAFYLHVADKNLQSRILPRLLLDSGP